MHLPVLWLQNGNSAGRLVVNLQACAVGILLLLQVLALLSPSCSHDKVVLPFKAGPHYSTPLLVYEAQYLKSIKAVHSKLASLGEQCHGPPAGGQGPCGCMAELLLSETVTALGLMGVPQHAINKYVTCLPVFSRNGLSH